jgi:hypothetical protein
VAIEQPLNIKKTASAEYADSNELDGGKGSGSNAALDMGSILGTRFEKKLPFPPLSPHSLS